MNNPVTDQEKHIRKQGEGAVVFPGSPDAKVDTDCELVTFYEFTIDASKKRVWDVLKDQNVWIPDIKWDCVVGEESEQGKRVKMQPLQKMPDGSAVPVRFQKILTVIPEQLLVTSDPVSRDDDTGTIGGGVYVTTLAEHDGVTTVTTTMIKQSWSPEVNQGAVDDTKYWIDNVHERWEEVYIPTLRKLVMEN